MGRQHSAQYSPCFSALLLLLLLSNSVSLAARVRRSTAATVERKSSKGDAVAFGGVVPLAFLQSQQDHRDPQTSSSYGPGNCVHVSRSAESGTCILETKCPLGEVLAQVDFGFVCEDEDAKALTGESSTGTIASRRRLHSYGRGGFADEEAFDTGIKCGRCRVPDEGDFAELALASGQAGQDPAENSNAVAANSILPTDGFNGTVPEAGPARARSLVQLLQLVQRREDSAVSFGAGSSAPIFVSSAGPGRCVSTYKSPAGTCILETHCSAEQEWVAELASAYRPGFTCVDAKAQSARHIYGVASFRPEERFDSLVECEACLGLDTRSKRKIDRQQRLGRGSVVEVIRSLREDLKSAAAEVVSLQGSVEQLKEKVYDEPARAAKVNPESALTLHKKKKDPPAAAVIVHKKKKKLKRDDVVRKLAAEERVDEEIERRRWRRLRARRRRDEEEDRGENEEDADERPDPEVERTAEGEEGDGLTEPAPRNWASGESAFSAGEDGEEGRKEESDDVEQEGTAEEDEKEDSGGAEEDGQEDEEDLEDVKSDAVEAEAEVEDVNRAETKEGLEDEKNA